MRKAQSDFVAVGRIVKAHGIKGEVKVKPLTDKPERFKRLSSIQIELPSREPFEAVIDQVSVKGDNIYLRLNGVASRDAAQALNGATLTIPEEDLLPLADDEFYLFELVGFTVKTVAGDVLGTVSEVMDLSSNEVLVVRSDERECLIPVIQDVIVEMNMDAQQIVIQPIDGLLD